MAPSKKDNHGFTLMEMSVVLVIIGLIIGGITIGQSLIRQSQINSVLTDVQRYVQATQNFQAKYGALPGDFSGTSVTAGGAAALWGAGTTCPPTSVLPLTPPATCNGDGNGQIGISGATTVAPEEYFYYWEHLINGQFIQGSFSGTPGSAGSADHVFGTNSPGSRVKGAGFGISWVGTINNGTSYYYPNNFGHVLFFGGYKSNSLPAGNILKPLEALSIDSKFDDGYPGTGNIQTWQQTGSYQCTTSATQPSSYNNALSDYECSLLFITGF